MSALQSAAVVLHGATERATAIEALSRRFRIPLERYFEKRIGRQAEIDDLVQEVFLHGSRRRRDTRLAVDDSNLKSE